MYVVLTVFIFLKSYFGFQQPRAHLTIKPSCVSVPTTPRASSSTVSSVVAHFIRAVEPVMNRGCCCCRCFSFKSPGSPSRTIRDTCAHSAAAAISSTLHATPSSVSTFGPEELRHTAAAAAVRSAAHIPAIPHFAAAAVAARRGTRRVSH